MKLGDDISVRSCNKLSLMERFTKWSCRSETESSLAKDDVCVFKKKLYKRTLFGIYEQNHILVLRLDSS